MSDFTLPSYRLLLDSFRDAGYRSVTMSKRIAPSHGLLLRHDVDFEPDFCLPLAEAEASIGFKSIFFFLVSSSFYNVYSSRVRRVLSQLVSQGHEIGLHFDCEAYNGNFLDMEELGKWEKSILSQVSGTTVQFTSFHRPKKGLVGREENFAGAAHTYQPHFIDDLKYVSDSRGEWRFGHPLKTAAFRERRSMQLLTHPIWWHSDAVHSPPERLRAFLARARLSLEQAIRQNSDVSFVTQFDFGRE